MAKRLGIVPHLFAAPLFNGLKKADGHSPFHVAENSSVQLALQLRRGELDGAFLSPLEYAKEYSSYQIVPDVGVISEGETGSIRLVFNEHLHHIKTIAIDPTYQSEIVLTHIVLSEKHNMKPKFVPLSVSVDDALSKTDAVLTVDRAALSCEGRKNTIDIVEEWFDITEMPFVYGFWVTREQALTDEDMNALITATRQVEPPVELNAHERAYLTNFRYSLDDEAIAALNEFYRMAYYHGILKDIPELKFISFQK
jgi:chorismate dehydratase